MNYKCTIQIDLPRPNRILHTSTSPPVRPIFLHLHVQNDSGKELLRRFDASQHEENAAHASMYADMQKVHLATLHRLKLELSPENASGEWRPPIRPAKSTLSLLTCLDPCWTCGGNAEAGCCAPARLCMPANGFICPAD